MQPIYKKILAILTPLRLLSIISFLIIVYVFAGLIFSYGHAGIGLIIAFFSLLVIIFSLLIDFVIVKELKSDLKKIWLLESGLIILFLGILLFM